MNDDAEDEMLNYQELFHRSNIQPSAQSNEIEDKKKRNLQILILLKQQLCDLLSS